MSASRFSSLHSSPPATSASSLSTLWVLLPAHLLEHDVLVYLFASVVWSVLVGWTYSQGIIPECFRVLTERILSGLASVTGLLLAFRSNSAVSRWDSGSKGWSVIHATSRSLLRLLAGALMDDDYLGEGGEQEDGGARESLSLHQEKRIQSLLRLVPSFSIALLEQLETQDSLMTDEAESGSGRAAAAARSTVKPWLSDIIPPSVRGRRRHGIKSGRGSRPRLRRLSSASVPPAAATSKEEIQQESEAKRETILSQNQDGERQLALRAVPLRNAEGQVLCSNLALDVLLQLQVELNRFHAGIRPATATGGQLSDGDGEDGESTPKEESFKGGVKEVKLAGPIFAHCIGLVNTLMSQMTDLERVRDVPMPALLSSHLRFLLHLQFVLTPLAFLTLVPPKWLFLPSALLSAATFGLHSLSERLAQPFGTQREKLPMKRWCAEIVREWREIADGWSEDIIVEDKEEKK